MATIASTVKDLSVSFPLIGQKEKERKQFLLQLQSIEGSQKETTQTPPIHVHMPFQPRQSLYKDLSIPSTSPFSLISPYQNLQPLAITHLDHNPFKPSGIFPAITYSTPSQPKPQARPQREPSPIRKDKEPLYQPPDPTVGASLKPPDMNMLAMDPDPPQTQFHRFSEPSHLRIQKNLLCSQ